MYTNRFMRDDASPNPGSIRAIRWVYGAAVAFMIFFAIERARWSIAGYNPPPGARGIEPALWAALMGVFLVLVGVFPWEPFRARRKRAKRIENLQAGRRRAARIRRPAQRRKLLT